MIAAVAKRYGKLRKEVMPVEASRNPQKKTKNKRKRKFVEEKMVTDVTNVLPHSVNTYLNLYL